jgi:hypothetical protein
LTFGLKNEGGIFAEGDQKNGKLALLCLWRVLCLDGAALFVFCLVVLALRNMCVMCPVGAAPFVLCLVVLELRNMCMLCLVGAAPLVLCLVGAAQHVRAVSCWCCAFDTYHDLVAIGNVDLTTEICIGDREYTYKLLRGTAQGRSR